MRLTTNSADDSFDMRMTETPTPNYTGTSYVPPRRYWYSVLWGIDKAP